MAIVDVRMKRNKSEYLKLFNDEELQKELARRERKRKGKCLGYRAYFYGDEYNYGTQSDYPIGQMRDGVILKTKEIAKEQAQNSVNNHENGGYIEELFKYMLKELPKRY